MEGWDQHWHGPWLGFTGRGWCPFVSFVPANSSFSFGRNKFYIRLSCILWCNATKNVKGMTKGGRQLLLSLLIYLSIFLLFFMNYLKTNSHFLKKLQFYTITSTAKFYYRIMFFWQFSTPRGYLGGCGKLQNHSKVAPGGLWKWLYIFLGGRKKMKKSWQTKTHFPQCLPIVWPKRGISWESWRPGLSEIVEFFEFGRF